LALKNERGTDRIGGQDSAAEGVDRLAVERARRRDRDDLRRVFVVANEKRQIPEGR
jgi:hypothetical protein